MKGKSDNWHARIAPPVMLFLVVAATWHLATRAFNLPGFLLPSPITVVQEAWGHRGALVSATALTAAAALAGFACSVTAGCVIGFLFSHWTWIRRSCYPYAIFLQTVPIVAIAPLIIIWFGTGFHSVVLVSFIVSLFPMIANATAGLATQDRNLIALFEMYNATPLQTFAHLRFPAAVPYLVAGAKTSSGLSVIGAIVGEFFAGYGAENYGLGYLVIVTSGQLKTAYLFAAICCSTALGLAIFGTVTALGDTILKRWYKHLTHE